MNPDTERPPSLHYLNDYQERATSTAAELIPWSTSSILTMALGLTGEAGETADIVKKWYAQGHELDVPKLREELGDILWYVSGMATAIDVRLADIATENITKLRARYPEGFNREASINREIEVDIDPNPKIEELRLW
jgi:NTP pyrophosphatase (non-canonical NTP hydrolase)